MGSVAGMADDSVIVSRMIRDLNRDDGQQNLILYAIGTTGTMSLPVTRPVPIIASSATAGT
jgi:hypothetical protein